MPGLHRGDDLPRSTDWRAVLLGAAVTLGLDVGYFLVTQEPTGAGIFVGSATAGYLCDRSVRGSAWHGGLSGILGLTCLVALGAVVGGFPTTVVADLLGVGVVGVLLAALVVVSGSFPNAVAGALGGVARSAVEE
ncbi:DUF5518 domain-containing protein [Halorussus salinisoli]|uniref:DUF5518 domain-containing protein n=1 Tax=Halorussus salinisoli TaxID=2558242 RepID=UPI0010C19F0E|nr:DUF5518 domain-containing protein [Halorussus salinisoli]